jgi:hypothetical protein
VDRDHDDRERRHREPSDRSQERPGRREHDQPGGHRPGETTAKLPIRPPERDPQDASTRDVGRDREGEQYERLGGEEPGAAQHRGAAGDISALSAIIAIR